MCSCFLAECISSRANMQLYTTLPLTRMSRSSGMSVSCNVNSCASGCSSNARKLWVPRPRQRPWRISSTSPGVTLTVWSTASATPGYVRNRPWLPRSRNCAGFSNTWTGFLQQWHEEPVTYASQALPHVTAAHTLANYIMSGVHQQHDADTTLLNQALHSFQRHLVGYAIGLTFLMVLLMYMTWRHLHSEQARREVERRYREALQQAHDVLERRVEERTVELRAANASLQRESAERQRMAREMLEVSDREQRRIGQDLHDGLGQLLAGMAFLGQALAQKLARQGLAETAEATQLVQLANKAMTWARELVHGLSPVELEGDGFVVALQDLAMQAERLFGITCRVTCDRLPPMPDHTVATHLYRIAQEAVSNAVKHGQARHVVLALTPGQHSTTLTMDDDGIGFQEGANKPTGMGLRIMHYRASMIGASLAIHSDASSGTTVICEWPHPETTGDDGEMQQWRDGASTDPAR